MQQPDSSAVGLAGCRLASVSVPVQRYKAGGCPASMQHEATAPAEPESVQYCKAGGCPESVQHEAAASVLVPVPEAGCPTMAQVLVYHHHHHHPLSVESVVTAQSDAVTLQASCIHVGSQR